MSTIKVDTIKKLAGATQYPAHAWINFNGTGTPAIRGSGGINTTDGVTDNGVGDYTLNFSHNFSNAHYCCVSSVSWVGAGIAPRVQTDDTTDGTPTSKTAAQIRVSNVTDSNAHSDLDNQYWAFFG